MQQSFEINLSVVLAHSLVLETKNALSPNGIVDDARNGNDPPAPTAQESTREMLAAMQEGLPGLLDLYKDRLPGFEQSLADVRKTIAPQDQALNLELFKQFGPELNKIGRDIATANEQARAASDLKLLRESGKDLTSEYLKLARQVDPEFFKTRAEGAAGISNLLKDIGGLPQQRLLDETGQLSGGEQAAIERALNRAGARAGTLNAESPLSTIANAMRFGEAGRARELANRAENRATMAFRPSLLSEALKTTAGFLPTTRSGVDPFQITTGRPSTTDFGTSKFTGIPQGVGNQFFNTANQMMGQTGQFQNTAANINAQRRDTLDRVNETMSGVGSMVSI